MFIVTLLTIAKIWELCPIVERMDKERKIDFIFWAVEMFTIIKFFRLHIYGLYTFL